MPGIAASIARPPVSAWAAILACLAALAGVIAWAVAAAPAVAQPAARPAGVLATPDARAPIDIRRVTIVVRDIEASLKLYRDALGMKVNYDEAMTVSSPAFARGVPGRAIRLVLLNANDPWIGWIGLLQYTDPPLRPRRRKPPHEHDIASHIIVTAVDDAAKTCAAAAATPGVRLAFAPGVAEYPGRDGGPAIRVLSCHIWDPDGAYLELNQRLP
jgi:catechol 2,3-dioxygenase-like lactoylglutathione lyase family enzyme